MDVSSIDLLRDIASAIAFAVGGAFLLIGTFGLVRLPDVWSRLHAAGIVDTVGAELVLIGMMIQAGFTQATVKLLLISLFLFVTSPTATHAVANAAFIAGIRPVRLRRNEAADVIGETAKKATKS
ncbi:MAG: sodium:proton antiporter [Alphaproteobacteria bacterium HGW-Alphaproteobacteria-12]|nr:MAG: sodium:proton antiporter [Alphaproteobacteria bacterium HGW-Alphaproteobacteria-12]